MTNLEINIETKKSPTFVQAKLKIRTESQDDIHEYNGGNLQEILHVRRKIFS